MSRQTYEALQDALAAHIDDELDDHQIVTDWYLITAHVGTEAGVTGYTHICSDSPAHALNGLVWQAHRRLDREDT